jgi:DivIVA domain-containing protein
MDITPQLLKDIRLSDSFRGYNKDEVDELIERVGAAIVQLQGRLREAMERADGAEARAATMGGRSESEDTLRRTLVLAQRTADAAVAEANAEATRTLDDANEHASRTTADADAHASRTISEANERASKLLSDAEAQAAILRTETEAEVRRIAEESRAPLMEDIREAERVRNFLRDDIDLLERHLAAQRDRLRVHVAELTRIVEEPSTLRLEPAPETSGIEASSLLAPREPIASIVTPSAPLPPAFAPTPAYTPPSADDIDDDIDAEFDDDYDDDDGMAYAPDGLASLSTTYASPLPASTEPAWADDEDDTLPPGAASARFDDGPATRAIASIEDVPDRSGDQFLDQLRRAVDDEVGIDEGAMTEFFSADVDEGPRSRFGRRR